MREKAERAKRERRFTDQAGITVMVWRKRYVSAKSSLRGEGGGSNERERRISLSLSISLSRSLPSLLSELSLAPEALRQHLINNVSSCNQTTFHHQNQSPEPLRQHLVQVSLPPRQPRLYFISPAFFCYVSPCRRPAPVAQ